ncbi:MAG: class I SAM-dependent methyltransferase [Alphaproteobacteria bacterium]|nr:class I SAM-dependent methyltransferase [Alphaproteobacteria bacterium]
MSIVDRLKTADRKCPHPMLAQANHDELAHEHYALSLKLLLGRNFGPGSRKIFEQKAAPAYAKEHGHEPASIDDVRDAMKGEPYEKMVSALQVAAQRIMWNAVSTSIERELPRLEETARHSRQSNRKRGSLMLNPDVAMPAYIGHIDIHHQPDGYELNDHDDDVLAGALYESGGNLYSRGVAIGKNDSKAACLIGFLEETYPTLKPKRILDLGCSAGSATVPYAEAWPDTEVYGIDIGGGMLRYAHARAESLGLPVHFEQMNTTATHYPDGFFDLVVSHNLFHELTAADNKGTLKECYRITKPGGVVAHLDLPFKNAEKDLFTQYQGDFQTFNNAEPCWRVYANMDHTGALAQAGFAKDNITTTYRARKDGPGAWLIFAAER